MPESQPFLDPQTQIWVMFAVNLIAIIGGVSKALSVLVSLRNTFRDDMHDLKILIGTKVPPDGILGDVEGLKTETRRHRDSLIELGSEFGMRYPGGRS